MSDSYIESLPRASYRFRRWLLAAFGGEKPTAKPKRAMHALSCSCQTQDHRDKLGGG